MDTPTETPSAPTARDAHQRYRKKPVVIHAIQWTGTNFFEALGFCSSSRRGSMSQLGDKLVITTLEGDMRASNGDWIIRGIKGELHLCKPDIFHATYEPAGEEPTA